MCATDDCCNRYNNNITTTTTSPTTTTSATTKKRITAEISSFHLFYGETKAAAMVKKNVVVIL